MKERRLFLNGTNDGGGDASERETSRGGGQRKREDGDVYLARISLFRCYTSRWRGKWSHLVMEVTKGWERTGREVELV